MTEEDKAVLELARCGIWGTEPVLSQEIRDWAALRQIAGQRKLAPFVSFGCKLGHGLDCPGELYQKWSDTMRQEAIGRVLAAKELQKLQEELRSLGIETAVLKGLAVASAYPHPELRSGCDIDLYTDEEQEEAVYKWAEEGGCHVRRRVRGTHHGEIVHPMLGLIELHVSLCNADEALVEAAKDKDAVLLHPKRPYVTVINSGASLVTMEHTEHMLFIISHMINHYLHGEAEVRQLVDVNMYFFAYKKEMDAAYLWDVLKRLHYEYFFRTVLQIGNLFFGFSHEAGLVEGIDGERAQELLEDFFRITSEKEEILEVYDTYCSQVIPGGLPSFLFKCRIIGKNIKTALQLRGKMSWSSIFRLGVQRMRNLFLKGKGNRDGSRQKESDPRISMLKKMKLIG